MNKTELKETAWIGDAFVRQPIRGIILTFHGLGSGELRSEPNEEELIWAQNGYLVVYPYYGPWSWMNRQARAFVDDLVASVYENYCLPADIPLIAHGGSMGGFSALLYTRYAKHKVAGCAAVCPVCDLKSHFHERPDLPRTIRHAFLGYKEDMESLFREHSPVCQVEGLPRIPYFLIHITGDPAVNKALHSDKLVAEMRKRALDVKYCEVEGTGHCGPIPEDVQNAKTAFILDFVKDRH